MKWILLQLVCGITLVAHRGEVFEIDRVKGINTLWEVVVIRLPRFGIPPSDVAVTTVGAFAFVVHCYKRIVVGIDLCSSSGDCFQMNYVRKKALAECLQFLFQFGARNF
jgi:hypothetical protein